ncbi:uncharacterized protein BX664DRAFT_339218 [Halteromyces radiatus]|uniref:uncharacterized protein n=1 Tax=Halteromyces radiatus TaxID=101107 RepID=UPI002220F0BA|nr:uncharacterized protein BX664DRAFT_339218 [Halteromyces radiatus]KAI8082852.1 hypothetical protein BX664DRAFT_339218 [Halteromyces radiatus]
MNPIRVGLMQPTQQQQSADCDGWRDKLVGKTVVDDETITSLPEDKIVRKKDLPQFHRVLAPNSIMTMDYRPERLNIHVDANQQVKGVNYG